MLLGLNVLVLVTAGVNASRLSFLLPLDFSPSRAAHHQRYLTKVLPLLPPLHSADVVQDVLHIATQLPPANKAPSAAG